MKILLTHPNLINIVNKIQENCSTTITGSTNFEEVLAMAKAGEIEKIGIVFEITRINTLDFIKQIYKINPSIPILAWDCTLHFEELEEHPELLEDHIFFIDSARLKTDSFFECFDKFFSKTLTEFDFTELEKA